MTKIITKERPFQLQSLYAHPALFLPRATVDPLLAVDGFHPLRGPFFIGGACCIFGRRDVIAGEQVLYGFFSRCLKYSGIQGMR